MLDHFLEIFERFKKEEEEWRVELGVSAFPQLYRRLRGRIEISKTLLTKIRRLIELRGFRITIHAPHVHENVLPNLNLCSLNEREEALG